MRIMPIRYCSDVAAATRFYRALGLTQGDTSRPGAWVELPAPSGMLAIHQATGPEVGSCELAFEAEEPLEEVVDRLSRAGFTPGPIMDENYGRSVRVQDTDGIWVQINQHDRDLYT